MSHWFDRAATSGADDRGITRREGLRRAGAAVLLTSPLAGLAAATRPPAAAGKVPGESMYASKQEDDPCYTCQNEAWFRRKQRGHECRTRIRYQFPPGSGPLICRLLADIDYWTDRHECEVHSCQKPPPPAEPCEIQNRLSTRRGAGTCELVPPQDPPPTPPPEPPPDNGCANCTSVGGVCCYGGSNPTGYICACATPGVPCSVYGCS